MGDMTPGDDKGEVLSQSEIERLLSHNFKMSQMRQQMLTLAKPQAAAELTEQLLNLK